jgi:hypothetical protein
MGYVYWVRTKDIVSLDDGYIGVTGTNGSGRTPEQRLLQHHKTGRFCAYGKKEELIIETIFSGEDDKCFLKELELRPSERIGWNISPGGVGGYKGNSYVKQHGMPWRYKAIESRKQNLKEGKTIIWNKGKKLTGRNYDVVVANRKDRLPFQYTILNEITGQEYICIGYLDLMKLIDKSKTSAQKISKGLRVKDCPYVLVSKKTTKYKEKLSCAL